jgi:subtilase family serine protease
MRNRRRGLRTRPLLDQLDDRCLLSGYSPAPSTGYTPAQLTSAYGLNAIAFTSSSGSTVKGDGSGETIALIEAYHDPNLASDLKTFDQAYNLPTANLMVVNQAGSQTDSGWTGEESLDVEWTHAMAPGANILVVEAKSQNLQDLLNAVNTARNTAGVSVVSMSWGFSEMSNEASYDSYFTTPAGHVSITFIAASGDSGTVEYPSASPNVLSVGGTTLTLSSSGTYQSESAWYDSGGGYSRYEAEPSYQASVQTTGLRSTPDVAFDADPNTGVQSYETDSGSKQGSWQVVGGTSVGAPSWAALIAIVDQGRALVGKGSLDGATQTLPSLYAAPSTDLHAITASSSPSFLGGGGNFGF